MNYAERSFGAVLVEIVSRNWPECTGPFFGLHERGLRDREREDVVLSDVGTG